MLYMAIGLPSSGKSTYINKKAPKKALIVSPELIRQEFFKGNRDPLVEDEIRNRMLKQIEEALQEKKEVCIDDYNLTRWSRAQIINLAKKYDTPVIGYWFKVPVETSLKWNKERENPVPEYLIYRYREFFESPQLEEGFKEIKEVQFEA